MFTACQPADGDLDIDDLGPTEMHDGGSISVSLVTTLDDCFSCQIQGGFVALRSVQRARDNALAPRLTALLVTRSLDDTLALSRVLKRERITARIQAMTPREARKIFDLGKIPAIYLLENGRVVREWEASSQAAIVIGRNDIRDAVAEIRNAEAEQ